MRTTKVKRLWPVLALAPLFALAAIFGASLWHSGPGGLTPPAAEANGRDVSSATDRPGNTCIVDRSGSDYQCISNENTLSLTVTEVGGGTLSTNTVAYVTGAGGEGTTVRGPHWTYANIQISDGADPPVNFGKRGFGSFLLEPLGASGDGIDVKRSWADNDGEVWVFLDMDATNPRVTGNTIPAIVSGDSVVKITFTQGVDTSHDGSIRGLGSNPQDTLRAKMATTTPESRQIPLAGNEDTAGTADASGIVEFDVDVRDEDGNGLGGRITVAHEFTANSAVRDDIDMMGTNPYPTMEGTVVAPAINGAAPIPSADGIQLSGWAHEGPVELTVTVTHISGTGERTAFDPFTLYRAGPAHAIVFTEAGGPPDDPHRTTSDSTRYDGFGPLEINDVLGRAASAPARLIYEGADDAAAAILPEAEADRMIPSTWNTEKFPITIKNTATTGAYDVNFIAQGPADEDDMRETLATLGITVNVIGAPDAMAGTVASNLVEPGDNVRLTGVALTSGGENAFNPPCEGATGTSICTWTAKDAATQAVLATRSGPVGTDGTVSIPVNATAAPGTYTIVLSDTRTQGVAAPDRATSREVSFTVVGRPATYTLTGPDRIAAGQIGAFMVTAKDANGNLPYFPMDEPTAADVSIVVSGAGAASVTPLRLSEGKVRLNARGEASFQVRVNNDAPSGSITIDAVGLGDGLASKSVTIGPEALGAPVLQPPTTLQDESGTVTLAWTAGANSTQHWIAGIKKEDLDAGNIVIGTTVLWTAADTQTGHTFTGLEGGKVYLFTVTAGNAANEWSAWAPIREVTVGTPAPTSGGGPGNPFGN